MKKFNQLAKKKILKMFLSSRKTKVAKKFPNFFFFSAENRLGAERVNYIYLTLSRPLDVPVRRRARSRLGSFV